MNPYEIRLPQSYEELSERDRKLFDEAQELCNRIREATGHEAIDALLLGYPEDPHSCTIAASINCGLHITPGPSAAQLAGQLDVSYDEVEDYEYNGQTWLITAPGSVSLGPFSTVGEFIDGIAETVGTRCISQRLEVLAPYCFAEIATRSMREGGRRLRCMR
jgi:hypothetical protein